MQVEWLAQVLAADQLAAQGLDLLRAGLTALHAGRHTYHARRTGQPYAADADRHSNSVTDGFPAALCSGRGNSRVQAAAMSLAPVKGPHESAAAMP